MRLAFFLPRIQTSRAKFALKPSANFNKMLYRMASLIVGANTFPHALQKNIRSLLSGSNPRGILVGSAGQKNIEFT